jgi:hypothetical protein
MQIEAIRVVDWILNHPKRKLAFKNGSDLDIALALVAPGNHSHAAVDHDGNVNAVIIYAQDKKNKSLTIKHLLADRIGFESLRAAWMIYFPDYTVTGTRSKSGKIVKHSISDFK